MPRIIQISRSYDRKVSDGNYGSIGQFASITADLDEADDVQEVSKALYDLCKQEVERSMGTLTVGQKSGDRTPIHEQVLINPINGEPIERTEYAKDKLYCKKCKKQVGPCKMAGCDNCDFCQTTPETETHSSKPPRYAGDMALDEFNQETSSIDPKAGPK